MSRPPSSAPLSRRLAVVADAFRLALGQLGEARMIAIVLRAVALTILLTAPLWLMLLVISALLEFLLPAHLTLPFIGEVGFLGLFTKGLVSKTSWAFWTYVIAPLSLALVGLFLDRIVDLVETRHYPDLPPPRHMGLGETITYSLRFLGLTILVSLASIAAGSLFAPLAPVIYVLANGYLIAREYMETVALRRMPAREASRITSRNRATLLIAGAILAALLNVPFLNLVVPVLGVAVFTHLYHRLAPCPPRAAGPSG